jgi:two-component system sensor histidine kinase FlrB
MCPQHKIPTAGLSGVMQAFTAASERLATSYRDLECRVDELSEEVAALTRERLRQLTEKERLANRLERMLDVLPAGIVVLDGAGYVEQCNPAAVDLLGEPLQGALWRDVIRRAFAPRLDDGHEVSLKDGRRVSISTQPLRTECSGRESGGRESGQTVGQIVGQIMLLKDVTETRLLQERLGHYQRLSDLGEMAATLAHQIRTPLAAALLYASHLAHGDLGEADQRRFAEKVLSRLRHLEGLIRDTLLLARGGSMDRDVLTVGDLFRDVQQAMEAQLRAADSTLELIDGASQVRLRGNRAMLLAALQNLATNALQACGEGAHLRLLSQEVGGDAVDLALVDDGPGIPAELQDRVFQPFFTTRAQGTGLGLAIVRAIAQAHRGAVWVDSQPGKGCIFTLRLPRLDAGEAARCAALAS